MGKKLWEASKNKKTNSNLYAYEKFISKKFNLKLDHNYNKILNWSIKNSGKFCLRALQIKPQLFSNYFRSIV